MLFRYFLSYVALFLSVTSIAQTLTISSAANSSSNWSLSGGVLTVSGTANIQASVIENALANGDLLIQGSATSFIVSVNQAINSTTSGSNLTIGSLTNTGAVTISSSISVAGGLTFYGGNIAVNQNLTSTLSGADILLQATGAISLAASKVIQTANGDLTFRSNASGTAVVTPNSTTGAITLNSGSSLLSDGGNITLGGNFSGTEGSGLYATSALSGGSPGILINNATLNAAGGNINIYGKCSTSYDDGIRLQANISTTGSGNIGIYGEAFGGLTTGSPNVWFGGITFITNSSTIETENGNINVEGVLTNTQSNSTYALNFYRSVSSGVDTRDIQIISKTGDIQITADRGATEAGGMGHSSWGDIYFGSPKSGDWTATGDVKFSYSSFVGAGFKGYKVKTSGAVTYEPTATSFVNAQTFPYNSYYTLAAEASSLFLGKAGNTANISVASAVSIAGPIDIQGGYVEIDGNLTSTAAGDIFIKGVAGTNPSIEVQSGKTITKSGGVGTLTLQGDGLILNKGSITTSGTGVLNVIFWSDFDNDNDDGGVSQQGTISTNGGHVWLGGSNTNGGSYTWNGLEVGDGPSIGTTNFNSNAMNIYGNITTNGGDFLAWAGSSTASGGIDGIASDGSGDIVSVGSGNIVLITDMVYGSTGAAMYFTQSGGTFTLVPFEGSFNAAFNWNPVIQTSIGSTADDYNIQGANFDWLGIGELNSISKLTIGYYNGMLNNGTPVEFTNSSDITFSTATTAAGAVELYGGTINVNANLTSTLSGADILLEGSKVVQSSGTIVQTNAGDITYTATNTPWTNISEQTVFITAATAGGTMVNAQGGNISINGSFANTGTNNNNDVNVADVAVLISNSTLKTTGQGTLSINGSAYNNASTLGGFVWGVMFLNNCLVQTDNGAINITGVGGRSVPNSRGVIADNMSLRILSASGTITLNDAMPAGHTLSNYTGSYFKPASANAIRIGADGSLVTSSSSNVIFDADIVTFDGSPTILTSTGALTIRPVANSFTSALTTNNLTIPSTLTGLTLGKTGNTADLTLSAATIINGPITLYGGALTLSAALSTTNTSTGNMSLNGTTLSGGSLSVADGRTLTMNLSSNSNYAGSISGSSLHFVKDGTGTLTLPTPTSFNFANLTIEGGTFQLNANQQLTLTGTLTNDATFTLESGATFVQGTSVTGTGTYNIKQTIDNGAGSGSTLTGRYWYLGSPLQCARTTAFGSAASLNKVWAYTNPSGYTAVNDGDLLQPTAGYVHRRSDASTTLAFSGQNLYAQDETLTLGNTVGTYTGWHLKSNPYTAYLDWHEVFAASTNISPTYYIRSYNSTGNDVDALISYNQSTELAVDNTTLALSNAQARYLAPLQAFWVKVSAAAGTSGTLSLSRSYTSHETGNIGLKSSTIFPTLARVNLVDDARFDQMLVFMNQDMTNGVDQYDSEKMFVSGVASIYTMASGKKLVMNGLKNNKKKISVPLYLELPTSKVYQLQLSEYIMEDGLILLEDKQEGTIQDFTINTIYSFYANSGLLNNRFVLHFMAPDNGIGAQGPSNNWVEEENAINEGGSILVSSNGRGKVTIQQDIDQSSTSKGGVIIRDANGKVVYNGQLTGSATTLELNTPSGIYFVEVELNGQVEMKKIFVQQ